MLLEATIVAQFVIIVLLLLANAKYRQRPDFKTVEYLREQALNEKKRADGLQQKSYSVGAGGLFLDGKKAIDADKLAVLLAKAIEQGDGIAGPEAYVQMLLMVTDPEMEDYPEHLKRLYYRNDSHVAIWAGKATQLPATLKKLMED